MNAAPISSGHLRRSLVPVLTALALLTVVVLLRVCETGAEADAYHVQAEQLLQGHLVVDRFHPYGYTLLVALVMLLVGNSLVAGGIVSAVSAAVLVWATGRLAERLRPGGWLWGQLFASANAHVWVLGSMACSDMTAAALLATATVLVAACDGRASARRGLVVGLLLGFAFASRFATLTPAAVIGGWLWWRDRRWRTAGVLLVGLLLGYAPQGVISLGLTGSPLQGGNWHNLYFKVVCEYDLEQLQRAYDDDAMPTAGAFLREYGGDVLRQAVRDAVPSAVDVLPALMLGRPHAPSFGQLWPLLLTFAGLLGWRRHRPVGVWLCLLALVHIGTVCLFWPRARLFFAVLPLLLAGVAGLVAALPRPWLRAAAGCAFTALLLVVGAAHFRRYLDDQPTAEVALAQRLPTLVPRPFGVMGTWAMLPRYVRGKVWGYLAPIAATPAANWQAVVERMDAIGADLFLTGRASAEGLHAQLIAVPPPPGVRVLNDDGEVLLFERALPPSTWIRACTLTPERAYVGERLEWRLELSAEAERSQIYAAGCALQAPDGSQVMVMFEPAADGTFAGALAVPAAGRWTYAPFVLCTNGRAERTPVGELEVLAR